MYNGWFYYRDVYSKYVFGLGRDYLDISENDEHSSIPKGYKLVQQFNENIADRICEEINKQMKKAWKWLQKFENSNS